MPFVSYLIVDNKKNVAKLFADTFYGNSEIFVGVTDVHVCVLFQQQRRLDLLTITNPDNLDPEEKQKIVFLTARVHPGETPSSYVVQGQLSN